MESSQVSHKLLVTFHLFGCIGLPQFGKHFDDVCGHDFSQIDDPPEQVSGLPEYSAEFAIAALWCISTIRA